jgi:hypothetical protein
MLLAGAKWAAAPPCLWRFCDSRGAGHQPSAGADTGHGRVSSPLPSNGLLRGSGFEQIAVMADSAPLSTQRYSAILLSA